MQKSPESDFLKSLTDPGILYENAPCGYLSFTADGKIVKINQTLLSWLGYDQSEVVNKLFYTDLVSRGGKIYYEMFYMPLLQLQHNVNEINFDFQRFDGSKFPALINSTAFRDSHGKLVAINATVYNITDRKKYERELLEAKKQADAERNRFELLSDLIPEMIFTADASGEINYTNRRFTSFFGLLDGSFSADAILPKIHHQDRFKLFKYWKRAIAIGEEAQIELRLQNQEGTYQWHLVRALPTKGNDGEIEKWMGSCTDINRHITAIQHLDEFISVASHELKTPITSLRASLQLMDRLITQQGEPKLMMLMAQSKKSIEKMNTLVDDLLNTGNIKEGKLVLNIRKFDVSEWLNNTCSHVRLAGRYKLHISCEHGLNVYADEHRIDQVIVNFVNNAIKYAPLSSDIFISAYKDNDQIHVEVKDNGPGIAPDKLPYIFERYFRVSHSGAEYSGLGLGLYICAEIIKRHNGRIGVESNVGEGSKFWFSLPESTPTG
ncbi:PAS domain S-box-containing protein [Pedobacter sp. AK017]|uniref:PAS domain-containing sensor histidine kinase n=1 Tax=Pedobacter sp. AK017 TaxID=2723073 RepID=UPI001611D7EF|nr:PAS domain-containing sensor histidine kinase [Pedobacter sp. AK017]MBB5440466.1 PAS domain S-box-containing protein [Pedobacter sp. AK017]